MVARSAPGKMRLLLTTGSRQDECNIFLTTIEKNIIFDERGFLEDVHIDTFARLLEWHCGIKMQSPPLLQRPDMIENRSRDNHNIQILFSNHGVTGHWICTYYDRHVVHVFDSMNTMKLHADHVVFLDRLYPFHPEVQFHKVQQQLNATDCGLYAIAFAVCVCYGNMPDAIVFDGCLMRGHLYRMLIQNRFVEFPTHDINSSVSRKRCSDSQQERETNSSVSKICCSDSQQEGETNSCVTGIHYSEIEQKRETNSSVSKTRCNDTRQEQETNSSFSKTRCNETRKDRATRLEKRNKRKKRKVAASSLLSGMRDGETIVEEEIDIQYLGTMNVICEFCGSINFLCEQPPDKKCSLCCHKGKVVLPDLKEYPERLKELLTSKSTESQNFKENIRAYNGALAFASMGARGVPAVTGRGPYVFRVHG